MYHCMLGVWVRFFVCLFCLRLGVFTVVFCGHCLLVGLIVSTEAHSYDVALTHEILSLNLLTMLEFL